MLTEVRSEPDILSLSPFDYSQGDVCTVTVVNILDPHFDQTLSKISFLEQ